MQALIIVFIGILIGLDQYTKYIAVQNLKPIGTMSLIENIFSFTFVENRGAAFGIFQGKTIFLLIITISIVVGILYFYFKLPKTKVYNFVRFSLILIISGAIGNLIDRVKQGYVVDFLNATFIDFPVFNLADIYVVVGAAFMAVLVIFFIKDEEGKA